MYKPPHRFRNIIQILLLCAVVFIVLPVSLLCQAPVSVSVNTLHRGGVCVSDRSEAVPDTHQCNNARVGCEKKMLECITKLNEEAHSCLDCL